MRNIIDLTGKVFGSLTVLHMVRLKYDHRPYWQVRCECNREYPVSGMQLRSGFVLRCMSCSRRQTHSIKNNSLEFRKWSQLMGYYKNIEGAVCPQWADFDVFLKDMGPCESDQVMRKVHRNMPYQPGNVVWTKIKTARKGL